MVKDFFGNEINIGDEVAFMQIGYRQLKTGIVAKMTEKGTLIIEHERFNVGGTTTKQDASQVIVNKKAKSINEVVKIVEDTFDDHVRAEVGDYFGNPSAHLEGKADFLNDLKTNLNK